MTLAIHTIKPSQNKSWHVRPYRPEDKPSLLRLSAFHYGEKELATEAYFDWLYSGSPGGCPFVVVAEALESGEIIGFLWHVPFRATVDGVSGTGQLGCNGLVHPDYRRQGIYQVFHKLVFEELQDSLFIYGFPKPIAVQPLKKSNIFQVGAIPLLVRPLNIARLTQSRLSSWPVQLAVNAGWRVAGATLWRPQSSVSQMTKVQITHQESFDESFDHFWARVVNKYDIMLYRDRAFLTWRFCRASFRHYHILAARSGSELVGYAVLRYLDLEGVRTGLIMDFLVEPGSRGEQAGLQLAQESIGWFQSTQADLAGCLMLPHSQEYAILRRAGYVECPERFAPQAFRLTTISLSPQVSNDVLAQRNRWFVTMANHDAV